MEAESNPRLVQFHIQLLNYGASQFSQPASDVKVTITLMPHNAEFLVTKLVHRLSCSKIGKIISLHLSYGMR